MSTRLTTAQFADLAGIDARRARRAISRALENKPWRGARLVVEPVSGRGGLAGQSYTVRADSLPADLQQRLKDHFAIVDHPVSRIDDRGSNKHDWYLVILSQAGVLALPPRSRERRAAIESLVARPLPDWNKPPRNKRLSIRTVERWLEKYHRRGAKAFVRLSRKDKNRGRVAISIAWDKAVNLDPVTSSKISEQLCKYVRGLIADGAERTVINPLAADRLRVLTLEVGIDVESLPAAVFALPRRFIDQNLRLKNVYRFDKNRKAHEDAKPRIHRNRKDLVPMQLVCGDVHHLDIVMLRPDGSEAWAKAICWLDMATNRIWITLVLLDKGEGIRNAHVIDSFIEMVTAWGFPQSLYLDNGSEYRFAEFVQDAMKLVADIDYFDDRSSQITRAKPYNAAAKAIEGIFGRLEQNYFKTIEGWAGGDRTNKRTHQVGKSTKPFTGGLDGLRHAIGNCITLYEFNTQGGENGLNGKSPRQVTDDFIAAGLYSRTALDPRQLHVAFSEPVTRIPRQGCISFDGDKWTCRELQKFQGRSVIVRAPKFHRFSVLPLVDPVTQEIIGYAEREQSYRILDSAGAREAAKREKANRAGIRELRASSSKVNTNVEIGRFVSSLAPALLAPVTGTLSISDQHAEIARGMAETPATRRERAQDQAEREHRSRLAIIESALKKGGR